MFSHAPIQRRTTEPEFRGSQRDIARMVRESAFDGAAFHGAQMLRFFFAPRASYRHRRRDRRDQLVIAPGLENKIRRAKFERLHRERDAPIRRHQYHSETRVEGMDA